MKEREVVHLEDKPHISGMESVDATHPHYPLDPTHDNAYVVNEIVSHFEAMAERRLR